MWPDDLYFCVLGNPNLPGGDIFGEISWLSSNNFFYQLKINYSGLKFILAQQMQQSGQRTIEMDCKDLLYISQSTHLQQKVTQFFNNTTCDTSEIITSLRNQLLEQYFLVFILYAKTGVSTHDWIEYCSNDSSATDSIDTEPDDSSIQVQLKFKSPPYTFTPFTQLLQYFFH
eukprot:TRINITY_DN23209_c0_g1_i1.p1 TRINITY_DN23209_c0_g1~~TRINITY_DN23209_c0_g1_i1.p1  ORF type:complete len:172 (-),score=22.56 TRINITY_DN23209_c0_g1_i1:228-743(-)